MSLSGRRALVTGGSSGIGRATCIRLAHEGAAVCVNYYSDSERDDVHAVMAAVDEAGPQGLALQAMSETSVP